MSTDTFELIQKRNCSVLEMLESLQSNQISLSIKKKNHTGEKLMNIMNVEKPVA